MKWYTHTYYVDLETGEVLEWYKDTQWKYEIRNKKIIHNIKQSYDRTQQIGIKYVINECSRRQYIQAELPIPGKRRR